MLKKAKVLSGILATVCILNLMPTRVSYAKEFNNNQIDVIELNNAKALETYNVSNNQCFKTLNIDDTIVYSLQGENGNLEYAYNKDDIVYYKKYTNNKLVEQKEYDDDYFSTTEKKLSLSQQEIIFNTIKNNNFNTAQELKSELLNKGINKIRVYEKNGAFFIEPLISNTYSRSSTTSVDIGLDGLANAFPVMNQKYVGGKYFMAKPEPLKFTLMRCHDTRNVYVSTNPKTFNLKPGTKVITAAAKVYLSPKKLTAVLGLASSIYQLPNAVNFSRAITAKSSVMRQACIYDSTNFNQIVSVYTTNGTDTFSVGKPSDNSEYGWFCEYQSLFDREDITDIINEGIRIWQYNMDEFGYWKWGNV